MSPARPDERTRASTWALRWHATQRIARQELRETLLGWGLFVTVALALLAAVGLVYNSVRFAGESGLAILARPYLTPLVIATTLSLLFVTVLATLAVARPREQGALQVLFFGPVDGPALILAHYLAGMAAFALAIALLVPPLLLLALLTRIPVPPALLLGLVPTVLTAGLGVAFGLFLSAAAPSGRAAILFLVGATLLLLSLQAGYSALLNVPPTSRYYDGLLFARLFLRSVNGLLAWVSPFGMLSGGLSAALRADLPEVLATVLRAIGSTGLWLLLAIRALSRRGVLP